MPQLVKGGKYVFGWSIINENGKIIVPKEAYYEYKLDEHEKIVLLSGSSSSGGFAVTTIEYLKKAPFKGILEILGYSEESDSFETPELKLINFKKNRHCCWTKLDEEGFFTLSHEVLEIFGLKIEDRTLVVRGSGHALGFIIRGRIFETAIMYPDLEIFK